MDISRLTTESRNEHSSKLDTLTPEQFVDVMNNEDQKVAQFIKEENHAIAQLITQVINGLNNGGRLIYMGAGTSGRLGVLDAAECVPTFGVTPDVVVGLIAGGPSAMTVAVEGAEDDESLGEQDLRDLNINEHDTVIGIAASGRTPYVIGGLRYAQSINVPTGCVTCNKASEVGKHADYPVQVDVGPEVLTGSTRLKAGTAQKLILNMISTGAMVGIGKVYENLMIDVKPTNKKLKQRAVNMIQEVLQTTDEDSERLFNQSDEQVKVAIVMGMHGISKEEALVRLKQAKGFVRNT
ncbi:MULTISPECIES: N-acetylmuramic acid 6-phosphate etherase [Mammaliicoccus]|jgi:N-acetylmuramic acid 6-phosphate etherase|uniref:SIS domain-containing protein n=1 Tax=Acyrthosiphon pisum TaxID=7029 RepID=A0A8R2BAZ3_ACYPI|nr:MULTISPECIES: N-acetylmuramic acid 6-phosphate etherase [Mammaliicoccus]MBO1219436.1 N-acetylmuramic acid 6-phosphate etherase [Mammaliicoccus sciuri]MBO1233105.1 N-acetylmuramic acid 6-phosphate etherase [Mammaliicoccus sciuri]PNY96821.1 N-acetylmuramic acid 6-phosphate etherase [Mammaliicoccus sciuri]PTJ81956.1 N-acetylmuramic acid 6-phosphate etherase [Mammaliicoccus sciuri]PTK01826.1 N-acetylmuramic acid 6-phosphate etherase [Mammaliicoccus sciuri]|eukprot:XP_008189125.1 PREDICTED: N-acetylmuramic acid 6-phosphate etherase 2-like [Acyrthosiphon pisum]